MQAPQPHAIEQLKDRCVCADSQGKGKYSGCSEAGTSPKRTECMAQVLGHLLGPYPAPRFPRLFLEQGRVAERSQRGVTGFFRAHACGEVLGNLLFEMELEFVV